jgi:hypothetical protein
MMCHIQPTPPQRDMLAEVDMARRALEALSCLIGSTNDLHTVRSDDLCALLDLINRALPADNR